MPKPKKNATSGGNMLDLKLLSFHDWLVKIRRELHQIPELGYKEDKTAARITAYLDQLQIPYQTKVGKTGIVARLTSRKKGPLVAFRADMDALPLEESNDLPYKSKHPGMMHACGHDGHVTVALGIIRWLKEKKWIENGRGEILFFFQPAEEGGAGAKAMLDTGLYDAEPVAAIFAGHMNPELPVGQVELIYGTAHAAADTVKIRIKGKGGHGATPHLCIDPILAAAHLITQLQMFTSRNLAPLEGAVLSICEFHAGTAENIIPENAELKGTLRTLTPEVRELAVRRIEEMTRGLDQTFGVTATFELIDGYPAHVNHTELVDFMKSCTQDVLGIEAVQIGDSRMGAEDYSYFCQKWPGVMVGLGCHDPAKGFQFPLHSPYFDMDEGVLDAGVRLFGNAIVRFLDRSQRGVESQEIIKTWPTNLGKKQKY
jgi:amidohydrolase